MFRRPPGFERLSTSRKPYGSDRWKSSATPRAAAGRGNAAYAFARRSPLATTTATIDVGTRVDRDLAVAWHSRATAKKQLYEFPFCERESRRRRAGQGTARGRDEDGDGIPGKDWTKQT
jgi:hypothetical protein